LRTFETCLAIVPSYVSGARPDRYLKHRHSKDYAGDGFADRGRDLLVRFGE